MPVIHHIAGMQLEPEDVKKMKEAQGVPNARELVPPVKANSKNMIEAINLKAKRSKVSVPKNISEYTVSELQMYFADEKNFKKKAEYNNKK